MVVPIGLSLVPIPEAEVREPHRHLDRRRVRRGVPYAGHHLVGCAGHQRLRIDYDPSLQDRHVRVLPGDGQPLRQEVLLAIDHRIGLRVQMRRHMLAVGTGGRLITRRPRLAFLPPPHEQQSGVNDDRDKRNQAADAG